MKIFPIQLDDVLHKNLKLAAINQEITLHELIVEALKLYLNQNNKIAKSEGKYENKS